MPSPPYKLRARGFESYTVYFDSHKLFRLIFQILLQYSQKNRKLCVAKTWITSAFCKLIRSMFSPHYGFDIFLTILMFCNDQKLLNPNPASSQDMGFTDREWWNSVIDKPNGAPFCIIFNPQSLISNSYITQVFSITF